MLYVVCGPDLGPDVLQVRHGCCRSQRGPGALQRTRGFGGGAHDRHLLHLVDLGLPGGRLAGGRLGRPGAALSTLSILNKQRRHRVKRVKQVHSGDGGTTTESSKKAELIFSKVCLEAGRV